MLILKTATYHDAEKLKTFYGTYREPYLLPRPAIEFDLAIEKGNYFFLDFNDTIVAASGIFDYDDEGASVELAETCVTRPLRGYGLQDLFFELRTSQISIFQGEDIDVTTAVDPANSISLKNTLKQGFEKWRPIPAALNSCPSCPNKPGVWAYIRSGLTRSCCCDFYVLPIDEKRKLASSLLQRYDSQGSKITLRNKAGSLHVMDVACRLLVDEGSYEALRLFSLG